MDVLKDVWMGFWMAVEKEKLLDYTSVVLMASLMAALMVAAMVCE